MRTEIVLHVGGEPIRRTVDGLTTIGGSQADDIAVPGMAAAAVSVKPCAAGLVLCPAVSGLRVGGRAVFPGSLRLLRCGERATLLGRSIELATPVPADGTRAGAAALLRKAAGGRGFPSGPHLVVLTGGGAGMQVALERELIVGRGRMAALRVRDPAVSRRHARVRRGPGGVTVEDLGAKNRLRVNGVAVDRRPVLLGPGDRITVGETELVYDDGARPGASAGGGERTRPRRRRAGPGPPLFAAALLAIAAAILGAVSCGS